MEAPISEKKYIYIFGVGGKKLFLVMAGCNQTATDQSQLAVWLTLAMRIKCFGSACLSRNTGKPKPHFFCSEGLRELTLFL